MTDEIPELGGKSVRQFDACTNEFPRGGKVRLDTQEPMLGLVTERIVEVAVEGQQPRRIVVGESFSLPGGDSPMTIANDADEVLAGVITFRLQ